MNAADPDRTAVAYRIKAIRDGYFVPVVIDRGGREHEGNVCVCIPQAAYQTLIRASGRRNLEFLGISGYTETTGHRDVIVASELPVCMVTDPAHTHVHRANVEVVWG